MFYSGLLSTPAEFDAFSINTYLENAEKELEVVAEILYVSSPDHAHKVGCGHHIL